MGGGRRRPALVGEVALWGFPAGLIGGRLYFDLTSSNLVPHALVGAVRGLGGRARHLGRDRRRSPRRAVGAAPPRRRDAAVHGRRRPGAARRPGDRPDRQLLQPGAVRRTDDAAVGTRDQPAHRPAGYAQYATFHPTFLYELIWNLALAGLLVWLGRRRVIRRPACSRCMSPGTRSADRRGAPARRSGTPDPRPAPELLRRHGAVSGGGGVVRADPAGRDGAPTRGRRTRRTGALLAAGGALALAGCGHGGATPHSAGAVAPPPAHRAFTIV